MIGVIADRAEQEVIREFFELFKTPWEMCRRGRQYDAVLCQGENQFTGSASVVIHYSGKRTQQDFEQNIAIGSQGHHAFVCSYRGSRLPIYGESLRFGSTGVAFLSDEDSGECVGYLQASEAGVMARIGYDLFAEVRTLLTEGQPAVHASIPTLELHIAVLRSVITGAGVSLVEIPPVPEGYSFIACLTHDVDHPSIRQHGWDHTTFGFLFRAIVGSLRKFFSGRMTAGDVCRNWAAALKLPLVHLGFAKDFWMGFADRYLELEKGLHATYFMMPFAGEPGRGEEGPAPAFRAGGYKARDLNRTIEELQAAGCEVGLHGIDAWADSGDARAELEEIQSVAGTRETGVRIHWLYYDHDSPRILEEAGAAYDSTIGYREAVGYRAGTLQTYRPLGVRRILELPLHAMDTALFFMSYLGLSQQEASRVLSQMADEATRYGGCLTINWHDRSILPERLWDTCYKGLLLDLRCRGSWFATAGQAASWFRKRRSVLFEIDSSTPHKVRANLTDDQHDDLPGLRLRIHNGRQKSGLGVQGSADYVDQPIARGVGSTALSGARL